MLRAPFFLAILLLFVASCDTSDPSSVSGPDHAETALTLSSEGSEITPGFRFLPPLAPASVVGGAVDLDRSPRVEICRVDSDSSLDCGSSPAFPEGSVRQLGEHYEVLWQASEFDAVEGQLFQIEVWLGEVRLGYQQVEFEAQGGARARGQSNQAGTDRTVPIRFSIYEDAVLHALAGECEIGGVIVDCDVQLGNGSEETILTVYSEEGRVAGLVRIPVQDDPAFGTYLASLRHLAEAIAGASIPTDEQIPYFLQVQAVDEDGTAVSFSPGAYLALCQPPDVSSGMISSLSIFRVSAGETEILDTNRNTPECFDSSALNGANRETRPLLRRGLDMVAGLVRAQPLGALHGGLNTTTSVFSDFGATLVDEASFDYGETFTWKSDAGEGVGPAPFFTPGDFSICPNLSDVATGTGGASVWPLGDLGPGQGTLLTLEKSFLVPEGAKGLRIWAAIDNDIQVRVNGVDITAKWKENKESTAKPANARFVEIDKDGFLVHEGCAWHDSVHFPTEDIKPGAVNHLEVIARDRGTIGYVNVRVEVY